MAIEIQNRIGIELQTDINIYKYRQADEVQDQNSSH